MTDKYEFWLGFAKLPSVDWDMDNLIQVLTKINLQVSKKSQIYSQLFNPAFFISKEQISRVLSHIHRTFLLKTNISNQPSVEFLLYFGAERQIGKALDLVGLKSLKDSTPSDIIGLIIFGENTLDNLKIQEIINQFIPFNFNFTPIKLDLSINELLTVQSHFKIPDGVLWRIIKCNQEYITSTQLHSISEFAQLPRSLILYALEDAVNEKMIRMYVENNKR